MEAIIGFAFNGFCARHWPQVAQQHRRHDPYDLVVRGYPPLANYECFTLRWRQMPPGANALCNCAEAVLMIALTTKWYEDQLQLPEQQRAARPPALEVRCRVGLTRNAMKRRLERLGLDHFPVYEYIVQRDGFELISGRPREDKRAIVFIDQDLANGFPNAHWTFTTVIHQDVPEEVPVESIVVYSEFPFVLPAIAQQVYWRAQLTPENRAQYTEMRAVGQACDCDWNVLCEHEQHFQNVIQMQARRLLRVTLDGETHVVGTLMGQIRAGIRPGFRVRSSDNGGIVVKTPQGTVIRRKHVGRGIPLTTTWLGKLGRLTTTSMIAPMLDRGSFNFAPYRMQIYEFQDSSDIDQFTEGSFFNFVKRAGLGLLTHTTQPVVPLEMQEPAMAWGADEDLNLRLPRKAELLNRLATRAELTEAGALDVLRRMAAEERWDVDIDNEEIKVWVKRVVTVQGQAMEVAAPQSDNCWSCLQKRKTKWHLCKECKALSKDFPPEPALLWDTFAAHVGFRPLWSKTFTPPIAPLKDSVKIVDRHRNRVLYPQTRLPDNDATNHLFSLFRSQIAPISCRGYLRGPMFLCQDVTCFPMGEGTAAIAFLIRLGTRRVCQAQTWFFNLIFWWAHEVMHHFTQLDHESWQLFLSHFSGEKRKKMEEARQEDCDGWAEPYRSRSEGMCKKKLSELHDYRDALVYVTMSGFAKSEKSCSTTYEPDVFLVTKEQEKPRFICSPNPIALSRLGPYTHAQTKWLASKFTHRDSMFYAGCSTPEELHVWLNWSLEQVPEPWSLVDDISAMDSNHSRESFAFHAAVRAVQFPHIHPWISGAFEGEEEFSVRIGRYMCSVAHVNASGVSDTSYKNSLLCLYVRAFAIVHAFSDIRQMDHETLLLWLKTLLSNVVMAASGDDGLARLPSKLFGVHISAFSMDRYKEAWSWAGFSIKVCLVPPNRWRMATFLAQRPVWVGHRYEWAPEPARRMRGMFWQLDNTMHPIAWARGIATQVLNQAKAVPVLSDICAWYLDNTSGPVAVVTAQEKYSPFANSVCTGDRNRRGMLEFLLDYGLLESDYMDFVVRLSNVRDVLVNLDHHVLRRIFEEES